MSAIRYSSGYSVRFYCFLQIAYPTTFYAIAIKHGVKNETLVKVNKGRRTFFHDFLLIIIFTPRHFFVKK